MSDIFRYPRWNCTGQTIWLDISFYFGNIYFIWVIFLDIQGNIVLDKQYDRILVFYFGNIYFMWVIFLDIQGNIVPYKQYD